MQIEVIDVGGVNSHSAKNGRQYQSVEVTYKNEAGQAGNKKLMSFSHPDVFKIAQTWTKGDSVNIDSVKDDNGYWQWTKVLADGQAPSARPAKASSPSPAARGNSFPTQDERAQTQVYIIRQSSLTNANATLATTGKVVSQDEVVQLAKVYERFVFRKTVMPSYKANRTAPKPIHLKELQEYALKHMDAEMSRDDLEADDELAIHQDENTVIVTLDKDLLQVPGKHFSWEISGKNWKRPDKWFDQTELEGMRLFFVQCIMGDTTDNIPGIKNYGKVKATKLLGGCSTEQEMFDVVHQLYSDDEEFIRNASCVWMRRSIDDIWRDRFDKFQESVGEECLEDTQETLEPS